MVDPVNHSTKAKTEKCKRGMETWWPESRADEHGKRLRKCEGIGATRMSHACTELSEGKLI